MVNYAKQRKTFFLNKNLNFWGFPVYVFFQPNCPSQRDRQTDRDSACPSCVCIN